MEAGGMAISVGSGGFLAAVGVPISAGGLALATAGTAVATKSAAGFMADASHSTTKSQNQSFIANKVKTGNEKRSRSHPKMYGKPGSIDKQYGKDGELEKYTVYDENGFLEKEVRITGKSHGNIPRPNVKYPVKNRNPKTGEVFIKLDVRKIEPNEIENDLRSTL